ncbi:sensor histidine kinase inhibitor, KipI family [Roseovarius azorensis]|uniref:Sensor histidine kinase inhibitor, KipI family n=1 Tax=Roseovarius azorensis TaxID=1287727 RepID=A0A1H7N3N2_9RHOB|nr:carboxyltransferase domain-containing protein [Roseovarius azorensis]SEL18182.1 sensor histidine kinase inhibitor, KipI family [Roseovarius azorensis]
MTPIGPDRSRIDPARDWPRIRTVGVDGLLVSFGDRLSEPANRAALAFRAALERAAPEGVEESATSLVSAYVRFNPLWNDHAAMRTALEAILVSRDWYDAPLPEGRRLWRIPTVYGTDLAPQLEEAAAAAGLVPEAAIASLSQSRVRVQTIGFAPGQPYLGELDPAWDIPRQKALTARVPEGALTVAIRQIVLFSVSAPTGWRHVGQTAIRLFRPEADTPFVLRPGDEVLFDAVSPEKLAAMRGDPDGGATAQALK